MWQKLRVDLPQVLGETPMVCDDHEEHDDGKISPNPWSRRNMLCRHPVRPPINPIVAKGREIHASWDLDKPR